MTQEDLASVLHVQRQTISNWELGKGKPDIYILYDICKFFDITADEMLTGNKPQELKVVNVVEERLKALEFYIADINEKGFYSILDEDIRDFFPIANNDFEHMMVIALALKKKGYNIIEVFRNGFSIYIESEAVAQKFKKDLDDIIESFIHGDDDYVLGKLTEIECITGKAMREVINNVMDELYTEHTGKLTYYWIDDVNSVRGFGSSKEECEEQAKMQGCEEYEILPLV